ncbi:MAG: hypothetical protein JOY66_04540 [Acetobacteraceae bacterium]|nr:hypothetical protein [Acetobacteraceae bacterium]
MDNRLWADALSTIWPLVVPLCAAFLISCAESSHGWCWVDADVGHSTGEDDLALYVAMITAVHV